MGHAYTGPINDNQAYSVGVSPSGGMVYVTGYSSQSITSSRIATVAYNAATGAQMWVQLYKGPRGR